MPSRPKVALLIESSNTYSRDLLHGIRSWQRSNDAWAIRLTEHARGAKPPAWLKTWKGDGIIARVENTSIANVLKATKLPVVDVSAALPSLPFIRVATDSEAATSLAIDHLRECGLHQFAYCGNNSFNWSQKRYKYFSDTLKSLGHSCFNYIVPPNKTKQPLRGDQEVDAIASWLLTLPKPIGVLACYDIRGQQVIEACQQAGIRVPDEVAVLGVHNDELLCDLCDPPLSSVIPDAKQAGFRAAEILSGLMKNKGDKRPSTPPTAHLIAPLGVARRQSTDLVAIDDPKLSDALRYIRHNANRGITVTDVLQAVPMSRTLLERKFKEHLGITPHHYILNNRLERVKTLLVNSKSSINEVADKCGFEHIEYLSVAFKRETGLTPTQYRKKHSIP